jgi:2-polyprenyl-3-methyl-5-hydroxy-6-metoxy-1,4-benzoquinol methylase
MKVSGLISMIKHRMNRENVYNAPAYWDAKASEYEGRSISMWPNPHLNSLYETEILGLIRPLLDESADCDVLDIGCGIGRFSRIFAEKGAKVHGIDFSPNTIHVAKELSKGYSITYESMSVFELESISLYDIVLCIGVLTVACKDEEQLRDALTRVRKSLKPGGRLLLIEPIHRGFLHRVLNMHMKAFVQNMKACGLVVHRVAQAHFLPTRLLLAFFPFPRWLTEPVYRIGQQLMTILGRRNTGDYKVIFASV